MRAEFAILTFYVTLAAAQVGPARVSEANHLKRENHPADAEALYTAALREAQASGVVDSRLAQSLNNLAAHYYERGKYAEAEPLYLQALDVHTTLGPDARRDLGATLSNLAVLYLAQARYREAMLPDLAWNWTSILRMQPE